MIKTIVIGMIITVLGIFALSFVDKATSMNLTSTNGYASVVTESDSTSSSTVSIYISGEINHGGTYYLTPEDTLAELITLAGGVTSDADATAYNPSLVIDTRRSFYIAPELTTSGVCVDETEEKVSINGGVSSDLVSIGLSSTQATNLISYRTSNDDFGALEDIQNVKGIGSATFEKVKNKICL